MTSPALAKMQAELLHELKECSRHAIGIYQEQLGKLHGQMLRKEEEVSQLRELLDNYRNSGAPSTKPKKSKVKGITDFVLGKKKTKPSSSSSSSSSHGESEIESYELEVPIDIEAAVTPEQARDAYNLLLLYYIQHQTVLHSIISQREMKIAEIESQLIRLGWVPPSPTGNEGEQRAGESEASLLGRESGLFFPSLSSVKPASGSSMVTQQDFEIVSCVGKGAFGKVFRVKKYSTGQMYAMKVMNKRSIIAQEYVKHTNVELEIMADMSHHPFIVSLHYAFQTETNVFLIMDFIGGGTLFDLLIARPTPLSEDEVRFYCGQVLLALIALHSNNIVYRDLKLENILLAEDGYIKLTDFGLSARAAPQERIHSFSGTATYLAPEILTDTSNRGHNRSVDLWCLGIMIFFMLTQEPPFWSENFQTLFDQIKYDEPTYEYYSNRLSPEAESLIRGLLTKDYTKRLGCGREGLEAVKTHPFFASVNWPSLLAKQEKPPFIPKINWGDSGDTILDEGQSAESIPVDMFKGFSFAASPVTVSSSSSASSSPLSASSSSSATSSPLSPSHSPASSSAASSKTGAGGTSGSNGSQSGWQSGKNSKLAFRGGSKKKKTRIRISMEIQIFSVYQLPTSCIGDNLYLQWKHHDFDKGDVCVRQGATDPAICNNDRTVEWPRNEKSNVSFEITLTRDRKTSVFDEKRFSFTLVSYSTADSPLRPSISAATSSLSSSSSSSSSSSASSSASSSPVASALANSQITPQTDNDYRLNQSTDLYKRIGEITIDLTQYAKHNTQEVKILSLSRSDQVGPTLTVKIICSWLYIDSKEVLKDKIEDPRKTGKSIAGHIMHIDGQQYFVYQRK